ncbi:AGAP001640-PA-like protein [Anopheles sinensis]|uniref:AGAP001640-PA-like protein n=1 Tax=Anopheles sinensis TaxID=74873 RepID=A0A084VGU5_ANOSI|nr:AGAP001640-PA-like protein [Anopheles sinensis]
MAGKVRHDYYVGNVPKKATEEQLRTHLSRYGDITGFEFRLENCAYCPTKVAFVLFAKPLEDESLAALNSKLFQEKRLLVVSTASEKYFTPLLTIVVRYLNEHVTEEDIYTYFEKFGPLECVQKPSHTYAYVSFVSNDSVKYAMKTQYRPLKGVEAYVVAVKRRISMFLEKRTPMVFASLVEKSDGLELFYDPAAENETTLLVTNIPRDTEEDDLLDFLGKYGKIIDWEMQKSATCVMTNIGYVTYQQPKMARTAFLSAPLCFQGVGLEVYNNKLRHNTNDSKRAIILKRTSVYLTDDEIFEQFSEYGTVQYIQRLDTVNYNTIVRLATAKAAEEAQSVTSIAGESVHIRSYTSRQYHLPMIVGPENTDYKHPKRMRKETLLQQIIDTEDRRNRVQLQTEFNDKYFNPNPHFYRNEVQVWNYPTTFGLTQFREFFKKYGTVINLRELKPNPTAPISFACISFDTKLEAKRVVKMNQRFMGSKRLLLLMADRKIFHDPALCVRVGNLTEEIMDEDIYDRFNMIGTVKYVYRPKVQEAIVCMVDEPCLRKAHKVLCVGRFPVDIAPLVTVVSAGTAQAGFTNVNLATMANPAGQSYGMDTMMPRGPMGPGIGMAQVPLPVPAPVPLPERSPVIMQVGGPSFMGGLVPMQSGGPQISPRMRGLMQAVEQTMIKSKNFTTLPMLDQFNVVHDIVNHCLNFPYFLALQADEKIRYLIAGRNGFKYTNIFTLFTYPEQVQMLSVIESYYRSTIGQGGIGPAYTENTSGSTMSQANTIVILTQNVETPYETSSDANNTTVLAATNDDDDDGGRLEGIDVPPAPSPPPMCINSRSASPGSDDAAAVKSRSMVLNGAAQRLREIALKKRQLDSEPADEATNASDQPSGKRRRKRSKIDDSYILDDNRIYVSNVPQEFNDRSIRELFGKYGNIVLVSEQKRQILNPNSNQNTKGFVIQYETNYQAIRALDMHLTILLGQLIRVDQFKKQYKERSDHAVSVTCTDKYSEVAIYETFKSCGDVRFIWTRVINGQETCIIDYKDRAAVQAALKITYLHSGGRCKAVAM